MTEDAHVERYGKTLDVHRVTPGSRYTLDGCVTLCRPCHGPKPKLPPGSLPPVLYLRLTPEHEVALLAFINAQRIKPDRTAVGLTALEELLAKDGFWPPKPPKPAR